MVPIDELSDDDRRSVSSWIGERPGTVLVIDALLHGAGRIALAGSAGSPDAVLIESALVPGEPQGFGDAAALLSLLRRADGWRCVELEHDLVEDVRTGFDREWGIARSVIDVVHVLDTAVEPRRHPMVRALAPDEATTLPAASSDLLPVRDLVARSAALGRMYVAVDDGIIVGQGGSIASGEAHADVGVHVAESHRGLGIATGAASMTCAELQRVGLTPVWGTGSHNAASLRVAEKVGFAEVARLEYLVRSR